MNQDEYVRKFFRYIPRYVTGSVIALGLLIAGIIGFKASLTSVRADGAVNVWWPTENAKVGDVQTFKAMVQDKNVSDYSMTWSVDGGQANAMTDSSSDFPHKEAAVDLKNWNWHGTGPYKVNFVATDNQGIELGRTTIDIYTVGPAQGPVSVVQVAGTSTTPVVPPIVDQGATTITQLTAITPQPPVAVATSGTLEVTWPTPQAVIPGLQTFKADLAQKNVDDYRLFWQVDGGQLNPMNSAGDHKEILVDLSNWRWHDAGPYKLTFIAQDINGKELGRKDVVVFSGQPNATEQQTAAIIQTQTQTQNQDQTPTAQTQTQNKIQTQTTQNNSGGLAGAKLFVNQYSAAALALKNMSWQSDQAFQINKIAKNPTATWLGNWSNIQNDVSGIMNAARSQGTTPVFVAYNIPGRDCGQYSAGGANDKNSYSNWIQSIASAIGSGKAAVILEPDALALTSCLSQSQIQDRYAMLAQAVSTLKAKGNISVYLDAGHPNWISSDDMANRLKQAGIQNADGFALNVSNFFTTSSNANYGSELSAKLGGKHFVIDTSRNGVGPTSDNQWCNPANRALGEQPTTLTGNSLIDAYLWIKTPGESDGSCNGGPSAGSWWTDYAVMLARNAAF